MSVDPRPDAAFEMGLDVRESMSSHTSSVGAARRMKIPSVSGRHMMLMVGARPLGNVRRRTELPSDS